MKSFDVHHPVTNALEALVHSNPSLTFIKEEKIIFRSQKKGNVAIISGGGAGHEPTHAGFVGTGCLTAAVSGEIFASPSTKQILSAVKVLGGDSKGVLLIVKNYTGDVLHFGLAGERARALGYDTEVVVIGDDVAVGRSKGGLVGRRAIAGTLLVHKSVGAFVEYHKDHTLAAAADLARAINDSLVTIGSSLDHAKVPGQPFESNLKENEMELGMGIHNEPGVKVLSPIPTVESLLKDHMLPKLLDQNDKDRAYVKFNPDDEVVLLVNNLGGIAPLVLQAVVNKTINMLASEYQIKPARVYFGTMMTALNGEGFSVTLLNATNVNSKLGNKVNVLDLLDAPTDAPGWPVKSYHTDAPTFDSKILNPEHEQVKKAGTFDYSHFEKFFKSGAEAVVKAEPEITRLDTLVGDGDCGTTLVSGVNGISENLTRLSKETLSEVLVELSDLVETYMGGTSGGLYSIFLSGLSQGIDVGANEPVTTKVFAKALETGLETLYKYTNARIGDSTVIDALEPFIKEFSKSLDLGSAIKAAEQGALSTGSIEAKFGRASYVEDSSSIPDPGAMGLVAFLKGVEAAF